MFRSLRWFPWVLFVVSMAACRGGGQARQAPDPLSPDTLHAWMAGGRFVSLLDTQPDSLFDFHHLVGAVRAHGLRVPDLREVLPPDPETPIVVYNHDGVPPPPDEDLAREAVGFGFRYVYWLEGGVLEWKARGYNLDGSRRFPRR